MILLSPFYRYSLSCWQEWDQVFTERSWQRKCTITWLVFSRLCNYSHGCCYTGIPFGGQDGRINRNKYVNLSNTVLMSLLDSHRLERSKTEGKDLLQLQPQPQLPQHPATSVLFSCFGVNLFLMPSWLCWPFSCLHMYYSLHWEYALVLAGMLGLHF